MAQRFLPTVKMPTTVSATIRVHHGEKSKKFNGLDFKRKQQKMLFYLTTLNLARFLNEEPPKLNEGETNMQVINVVDVWQHSDFLYRNYVMNRLHNSLYNVYCTIKIANELWESLN